VLLLFTAVYSTWHVFTGLAVDCVQYKTSSLCITDKPVEFYSKSIDDSVEILMHFFG